MIIPQEDMHDLFVQFVTKHPQFLLFDVKTCNVMDHYRQDKKDLTGYGMAEMHNVAGVYIFVYPSEQLVPVSVASNYFDGNMTIRALSVAVQIMMLNQMCWKASHELDEEFARLCADWQYAVRDYALDNLGFTDDECASILGFLD